MRCQLWAAGRDLVGEGSAKCAGAIGAASLALRADEFFTVAPQPALRSCALRAPLPVYAIFGRWARHQIAAPGAQIWPARPRASPGGVLRRMLKSGQQRPHP